MQPTKLLNIKIIGDKYMIMNRIIKNAFVLVILGLLFIPSIVFSSSFGSVNHGDFVSLDPGQAGEFKMSFLNFGNKELKIRLRVEEAPPNWTVDFYPGSILSIPGNQQTKTPGVSPGTGWFKLSNGYYVPIYSVWVRVTPPQTTSAGDHTIRVLAYTEPISTNSGEKNSKIFTGQSISQGRVFIFTVRVNKNGIFYSRYSPIISFNFQKNNITFGTNSFLQPLTPNSVVNDIVHGLMSQDVNKPEPLTNLIRFGKSAHTDTESDTHGSIKFNHKGEQSATGMITANSDEIGWTIVKILIILIVVYFVIRWVRG